MPITCIDINAIVFAQLPLGCPPTSVRSPACLYLTRGRSKDGTQASPSHDMGPTPQGRERSRPISLVSRCGRASLPCPGGRPAAFPQCLTCWPVSSCLLAVSWSTVFRVRVLFHLFLGKKSLSLTLVRPRGLYWLVLTCLHISFSNCAVNFLYSHLKPHETTSTPRKTHISTGLCCLLKGHVFRSLAW